MTERDNRAQDLVRTLLAEGWSQAEIARRIGRDPRLVRFVLKGLKPGKPGRGVNTVGAGRGGYPAAASA